MSELKHAGNGTAIPRGGAPGYLRIATEEAFATARNVRHVPQAARRPGVRRSRVSRVSGASISAARARAPPRIIERLQDLGERRLADMDDTGIDLQILSLTSPGRAGVRCRHGGARRARCQRRARGRDRKSSRALRRAGRRGTAGSQRRPRKEIERGVRKLGLKGVIINSHTHGEYLDDPKFWPIFEACEALDVPIYLHPNSAAEGDDRAVSSRPGSTARSTASASRPACTCCGSSWAASSTASPGCRSSSATAARRCRSGCIASTTCTARPSPPVRYPFMKPLQRKPSDYLRENVYVTNSGVAWEPAIMFCRAVLGAGPRDVRDGLPVPVRSQEVLASDGLPLTWRKRSSTSRATPSACSDCRRAAKAARSAHRSRHTAAPSRTASSAACSAGPTSSGREIVRAYAPPAAAAMPP